MPFCHPANHTKIHRYPENVGEIMLGDDIKTGPYVFRMMEEAKDPVKLCTVPALSKKDAYNLKKKIKDDYHVNMILDNLPITMNDLNYDEGTVLRGVDVGDVVLASEAPAAAGKEVMRPIVFNHLVFNVLVHKVRERRGARRPPPPGDRDRR